MKRCPECSFIYPDNDLHCDFDGTALLYFDDAEIDTKKNVKSLQPQPKSNRTSRFAMISVVVIFFVTATAFTSVLVYLKLRSHQRTISVAKKVETGQAIPQPRIAAIAHDLTPTPSPSPAATRTPLAAPQPSIERASRAAISRSPVSTSNPDQGKHPALIKLSSGATIEADEVWRTREGVWYRRNGMVTLIKAGEIRSINRR